MEERPTNGMSEQPKNDSLSLSIGIKNVFITIQIENIMYKRMFCNNFNFTKYCIGVLYSKAGSNQACKKCQW